jgi:ABC-type Mn2+/Zn2+ transport system ATPase subunit
MDEERQRGAMIVVATHDIQLASECNQAMLLARAVVATGPGEEILTPEALLKTFGIVLLYQGEDKGVGIVEREHGHN